MTPRERLDVEVDTSATFTVEGLGAGDTTITLTADHPFYDSASTDVTVSVYLPPVRLRVSSTPLQFEQMATGLLTIAVIDSTQATDNDKIG